MQRLRVLSGALTLALLLVAGAASAVDTGSADFSRYVSFGDSLTAGFNSGSLVRTFQVHSYPSLINLQATGQTTGFEQPLVNDPGIPNILELRSLVPFPIITPKPGTGTPANLLLPRPYNNMAVPGAKVHDVVATKFGGLHDLVLRNSPAAPPEQTFTQLQEGLSLRPTFATLWIGNNDVLGAATSGIVVEGVTLTPVPQFEAEYRAIVNAIAASGAKLALANIADVTSIPFVTTVPRFVTIPQTGQQVTLIGPNGPLQAGDFVLLTASAAIAQGQGIPGGPPLTDNQVLSASEVATIQARIQAYNSIISAVANEKGAALVDENARLKELATRGVSVGGITYSSAFLTGGVFSYDGVHPTAAGYALVANDFIAAINDKFGGDIPPVDLFPFVFGSASTTTAASASGGDKAAELTDFIFTEEARRSLLTSLGVPQWIIDGQPAPSTPGAGQRHPRGGRRGKG
jgi:phospholipase/lecithinase/hemolysin